MTTVEKIQYGVPMTVAEWDDLPPMWRRYAKRPVQPQPLTDHEMELTRFSGAAEIRQLQRRQFWMVARMVVLFALGAAICGWFLIFVERP